MPAYTTTPSNWTNSSDANFRAWGSAVSTKLGEVGLIQTADTGQINWASVLAPSGIDTYMGYEIWRFDDALQATAPVFLKIQYGSGNTSANNPGIRIQFGSGSNGSGTLTGVLSSLIDSECTAATNPMTAYWSGDVNRFAMCVFLGTGNTNVHLLMFERSKNSLGEDSAEAVLIMTKPLAATATTVSQIAWDTATGDKSTIETTVGVLLPSVGTGVTGTQKAVYPVLFTKGVFMNPGMNLLAYFTADLGADSNITLPIYGATHSYMTLGSANRWQPTNRSGRAVADVGYAMRYE